MSEASRYSALNLRPGSYFVAAVPDELAAAWNDPAFLETLARVAARVTIADGEIKTLDLKTVKIR